MDKIITIREDEFLSDDLAPDGFVLDDLGKDEFLILPA